MGLEEIVLTFFIVIGWPKFRPLARVYCGISHHEHFSVKYSLQITHQSVALSILICPVRKSMGNIIIEDLIFYWIRNGHLLFYDLFIFAIVWFVINSMFPVFGSFSVLLEIILQLPLLIVNPTSIIIPLLPASDIQTLLGKIGVVYSRMFVC